MKKRDRRALGEYIRHVADRMELRDWTLHLDSDPCHDSNNASMNSIYGRKIARIRVHEGFRTWEPERQRHAIVHELVHCHLWSATEMVQCDLAEHLKKQGDRIFWDGFRRQVEYGVDGLASAIAKHLPLIEWPS